MVARRGARFKWYVAAVTHVVRVRFTVEANYDGWRLDRYLQEKIRRLSRERVQRLIEERLECEDGRRLKPSTRVTPGLVFSLLKDAEPEPAAPIDFGIVHDDGELLVVDKPAGLPVHPTARYSENTFTTAARHRFPDRKVDPAHRLDRETSGLLACGSAPEWTKRLKRSFADGLIGKTYLALSLGEPAEARFTVDAPLAITGASAVRVRMHVADGGQPSVTEFEVLERRAAPDGAVVTLFACRPRTGRQHQNPRPPPPRRAAHRRRQDSTGPTRTSSIGSRATRSPTTTGSCSASSGRPSTPGGSSCRTRAPASACGSRRRSRPTSRRSGRPAGRSAVSRANLPRPPSRCGPAASRRARRTARAAPPPPPPGGRRAGRARPRAARPPSRA